MGRFVLFGLAAFLATAAHAEQAVVHQVIDGDTLYACGSGCYTVRISNIDTPEMPPRAKCEREAEMARIARIRLATAIEGRTVDLVTRGRTRDRYGRMLAHVMLGSEDIGETLIAEGIARRWTGRREPWC